MKKKVAFESKPQRFDLINTKKRADNVYTLFSVAILFLILRWIPQHPDIFQQ